MGKGVTFRLLCGLIKSDRKRNLLKSHMLRSCKDKQGYVRQRCNTDLKHLHSVEEVAWGSSFTSEKKEAEVPNIVCPFFPCRDSAIFGTILLQLWFWILETRWGHVDVLLGRSFAVLGGGTDVTWLLTCSLNIHLRHITACTSTFQSLNYSVKSFIMCVW